MKFVSKFFRLIETLGKWSAPVILLLARLLIGYGFFITGLGKLKHLDGTADYFASLHIPMPYVNAVMAGTTETVGGILLAIGLCGRLVSIPLTITMIVALLTAHRTETLNLFQDPDTFTKLNPIPFLLVVLFVFAFGPGGLSADALLKWFCKKKPGSSPDGERVKTAADAK